MLLARSGHKVLLVDRATFPSDTISTHFVWQPGVACLNRWGLLDRLKATGCPSVTELGFDPGPFQFKGTPPPDDGLTEMLGPRRTVLDKLLVDAAAESGVEVAEGFSVSEIVMEDGRVTGIRGRSRLGQEVLAKAKIVVGADGRNSMVARAVSAEVYNDRPTMTCVYYGYWSDMPAHVSTISPRERRVLITTPTHDGLTIVICVAPNDEFPTFKTDIEGAFMASLNLAPELAEIVNAGRRVERFYGSGDTPNFFRKPFGDGWALTGDAGYNRDPCTAQGISDAFRSAEWMADAIHAGLSGAKPMQQALAEFQSTRDTTFGPMYEMTFGLAQLAPPPPEVQALQQALVNNQAQADRFFGTMAGTVSIPEFYSPENVGRIMGGANAANA
jgi:2-polyprenyl-6-methoxyphenol hydroxylase-like FAD-dependent oxidoreductase